MGETGLQGFGDEVCGNIYSSLLSESEGQGSVFLVMANQERAKQGLENPVVHDTDAAIRVVVEAVRELIKEDQV